MTGDTAPTPTPTVGELLASALADELDRREAVEGEAEGWVAVLRETLDQALPRTVPPGDVRRVVAMVREAMDVPVPRVLAAAWQRYEPFRRYLDPEAYPLGTESEVPLAPHTARATLEPEVDVLVSGRVLATLRFPTEVTFELDGAVVLVRDGRFRSVRTGDCSIEVAVRFEGHELVRVGPEPETIPGVLHFGEDGIRIDPFGEDPYAPGEPGT